MDKASGKKEQHGEKGSSAEMATFPLQAFLTRPWPAFFLLTSLAVLIYSNTFSVPFFNDDNHIIVVNPWIKDISNVFDLSGTRYMGFLSFALNYHFGRLNVFGYHVVNLLIHITNGFLVYSLVRLLFRTPPLPSRHTPAPWMAFATALLFVSHPIQTQAVTYIAQRFASLAALFYLLSVVCYLKWRLAAFSIQNLRFKTQNWPWYAGALLSTILAMKTKENTFTLPFMFLLIEVVFFRPLTRKQWAAMIPFLMLMLMIPLSRVDALSGRELGFAQETTLISRLDYFLTQFPVIMTYLRLLVLPVRQNMLYDYPIHHSLLEPSVLLSFLFLLSLFITALFFLIHPKFKTPGFQLIAFGTLWFFLTLSVESSIIPISDVIFEHRLYLPSVGFFLTGCAAVERICSRWRSHRYREVMAVLSIVIICAILSVATYQRNIIWKDGVTFWTDVVVKNPNSANGHNFLGIAYQDQGRLDEAVQEYRTAIQLMPSHAMAHNGLGTVDQAQGRFDEAVQEYRLAIQIQPSLAEAHYNLGNTYKDLGALDKSTQELQAALKIQPYNAEAHYSLGVVYSDRGYWETALQEFQTAVKWRPGFSEAFNGLGNIYFHQGKLPEAVEKYQDALRFGPNNVEAHYNLGLAYARLGTFEKARRQYQEALQIKPDLEAARKALEALSR